MKKLLILFSCVLFAHGAFAWGQKGHDVTAYIAECNLTPEAAQEIDRVFEKVSEAWGKCRGKDKACDRRIILDEKGKEEHRMRATG